MEQLLHIALAIVIGFFLGAFVEAEIARPLQNAPLIAPICGE